MEWINVNDKLPVKYEEVIVCSRDGSVKSAVYLDNGKWTTYLSITYWMPYPEPPKLINVTEDSKEKVAEKPAEPIKKKRGRPKKS